MDEKVPVFECVFSLLLVSVFGIRRVSMWSSVFCHPVGVFGVLKKGVGGRIVWSGRLYVT